MEPLTEIRSVSIVMPTYNEAGNVGDLILESVACVRDAGVRDVEVIVVDDDSPDQTWKVAMEIRCPDARVRVIRRLQEHGLTASLNEGIAASTGEVVVWLDCDFSQHPDRIPQMLYMIRQGFDVAVNSRYVLGGGEARSGKGGALQLFLSKRLNVVLRFLLMGSFHDYTSGFIAVRREVFREISLRGDYGEYFIDFMYRVLRDSRYRVCELPYIMQPRRSGESKTGSNFLQFMLRGRKYLLTILRLKFGG
jgi:dolichol-phosphate mannosyltransferase